MSGPLDRMLYQDIARWEYGRILWKNPSLRERLLSHWKDERHPYRHRFLEKYEPYVTRIMIEGDTVTPSELDDALRAEGLSLREVIREIPPVFGSFWAVS